MLEFPLVLVPALGSDERLWEPVIDRLSDFVDCIVVRGEGNTMESMADSVLARAPQNFYLAGISMGGYVSLEIALRHTGRVKAVALLNTSAAAAPANRKANSLDLIEMVTNGGFEQAVDMISGSVAPQRPDVAALAATMARDLGPEVFKDQQTAVMNRADRHGELPALNVPALAIVGSSDSITPQNLGADLSALLPDSELVMLEGIGHLSALEDPDRVAQAIQQWLSRIESLRGVR